MRLGLGLRRDLDRAACKARLAALRVLRDEGVAVRARCLDLDADVIASAVAHVAVGGVVRRHAMRRAIDQDAHEGRRIIVLADVGGGEREGVAGRTGIRVRGAGGQLQRTGSRDRHGESEAKEQGTRDQRGERPCALARDECESNQDDPPVLGRWARKWTEDARCGAGGQWYLRPTARRRPAAPAHHVRRRSADTLVRGTTPAAVRRPRDQSPVDPK